MSERPGIAPGTSTSRLQRLEPTCLVAGEKVMDISVAHAKTLGNDRGGETLVEESQDNNLRLGIGTVLSDIPY